LESDHHPQPENHQQNNQEARNIKYPWKIFELSASTKFICDMFRSNKCFGVTVSAIFLATEAELPIMLNPRQSAEPESLKQ